MSLNMNGQAKWNVTSIRMSLKMECLPKIECLLKMECHSKWNITKNGLSV